MPALASQPARPVCFVCSSGFESGGGGGARWSSHYQVGRSTGRRRVRAHARTIHSACGAVCAPRTTRGDARECGSLRSRPRRSQSLAAAVRLARLDRRHLAAGAVLRYTIISLHKPPLRLVRTHEAGDSQPDGAPLGTLHLHPFARNRVTDVTRRRNAVVVVGGAPPLWFRRPRTALVQPLVQP